MCVNTFVKCPACKKHCSGEGSIEVYICERMPFDSACDVDGGPMEIERWMTMLEKQRNVWCDNEECPLNDTYRVKQTFEVHNAVREMREKNDGRPWDDDLTFVQRPKRRTTDFSWTKKNPPALPKAPGPNVFLPWIDDNENTYEEAMEAAKKLEHGPVKQMQDTGAGLLLLAKRLDRKAEHLTSKARAITQIGKHLTHQNEPNKIMEQCARQLREKINDDNDLLTTVAGMMGIDALCAAPSVDECATALAKVKNAKKMGGSNAPKEPEPVELNARGTEKRKTL